MIYFLHFLIGLVSSYIGTIPVGPINLSVVNTTIRRDLEAAKRLSIAAAFVEILQAFIALHCGMLVTDLISSVPALSLVIAIVLLVFGIFLWFKKPPQLDQNAPQIPKSKRSDYYRGLVVSLLNPQAIPFWIFVFAYVHTMNWLQYQFLAVTLLLLGITLGKYLALLSYAHLSALMAKRSDAIGTYLNKVIGGLLFVIGTVQIIRYLQ